MKTLGIACAAVGMALAAPAFAGRVAYVDYATLMQKAPQIKASENLLKQEFAPRLKAIRKMRSRVQSLRQQLNDVGPSGNPLKWSSLLEKYHHAEKALKKAEQSYQSGLSLRRAQLRDNFRQVMDDDIKAYAKAHGIELVLRRGGVFIGKAVDVTTQILDRLRSDYHKVQAQEKSTKKP